jgi:hypothetical protein
VERLLLGLLLLWLLSFSVVDILNQQGSCIFGLGECCMQKYMCGRGMYVVVVSFAPSRDSTSLKL